MGVTFLLTAALTVSPAVTAPQQPLAQALQRADGPGTTATVVSNAPIFILPDATTPLRVAAPQTTLNVLSERGDWVEVEFQDPQWGRRVGWVERKLISIH